MASFLFVRMGNAAYIMFIMWNYISGLEAWYHFQFNIICGVAVTVRIHQEKFQVIFQGGVRGAKKNGGEGQLSRSSSFLKLFSFLRLFSCLRLSSFFVIVFIFEVVSNFEVVFPFEVVSF